ncbi:MAG TPA: Rieske 2Fe-2S domain-containing protein [Pirellulales bacterium]|jgi:Rieske Fe-S protein
MTTHEDQVRDPAHEALPSPHRRQALGWLSAILGALSTTAAGLPILGYLLSPILRTPKNEWIDLGPIEKFPEQQTRLIDFVDPLSRPWDGETQRLAAYVRRTGGEKFQVFSVNCTHLGCPVSWFPQSGLFLCPCHGGVYYEDGSHASGPPPRGLFAYENRVKEGRLSIRAGRLPTLQEPA